MRDELLPALLVLTVIACSQPRETGDAGVCLACEGRIHPPGILDPASPDFHARVVEEHRGDLSVCARCHGDDFAGGITGLTCNRCHDAPQGPGACATCHAGWPDDGSHRAHRAWDCARCHVVPARWDAPGHVVGDRAPAEAFFLDRESGRCAVACHGDVRPRWNGGPDEAPCGSCHGAPPPDHAWDRCATCHPVGPTHADGVLQVGVACDACHGSDGEPAPPVDLFGNVVTGADGVGAHRSHVEATHRISAPVPCAACHPVPATRDAPGHIDTAPPVELTAGAGWLVDTRTCANACHGRARPRWTAVDAGEIACGACHGVPPATPAHDPALTLRDCARCHAGTVTAFGGIVVVAGASLHVNGVVDVD